MSDKAACSCLLFKILYETLIVTCQYSDHLQAHVSFDFRFQKADSRKTALYRKFNFEFKPNSADSTNSNPDIGIRDYIKSGSRDMVVNLIVAQLVYNFPVFYGKKKLTIARNPSQINPVQNVPPDLFNVCFTIIVPAVTRLA
jgi:hypothetical protein